MKCSVKIVLNEVTCPGILHLHDRSPVYLIVCLFGRMQRSQSVYPSFPMVFNCKMKFSRIFTNAKTPEQVMEILEDESVMLELKQEEKRSQCGVIIAKFEGIAKNFLFPSESCLPKENPLMRDVLLEKTGYFNNGKGLNPQLSLRTNTTLDVSTETCHHFNSILSKRLPIVSFSDVQHCKASPLPKRGRRRTEVAKRDDAPPPKDTPQMSNISTTMDTSLVYKHCICDCPKIAEINIDHWLEEYEKKLIEGKLIKPFRTGKEPLNLISKRDFKKESNIITKKRHSIKKRICQFCLIPSKSCVLCNAYKTVYGKDQFLLHRFSKKYGENLTTSEITTKTSKSVPSTPRKLSRTKPEESGKPSKSETNKPGKLCRTNPGSMFYNVPTSTPAEIRNTKLSNRCRMSAPPNCSKKKTIDGEYIEDELFDEPNYNHSSSTENGNDQQLYRERRHDQWENFSKSYPTVIASPTQSFDIESKRIHARIKELMMKNDSVLQHEILSDSSSQDSDLQSDSDSDDDESPSSSFSRVSIEEPPNSTSSRRSLPARSVAVPLEQNWWYDMEKMNATSRRDVFDTSLKNRYHVLYEKSVNSR